jgi:hypothetical protein
MKVTASRTMFEHAPHASLHLCSACVQPKLRDQPVPAPSLAFETGGIMLTKKERGLFSLRQLVAGFIGLIALGTIPAFGQGSTGAITGTVNDASGAVVSAAAVTVKHLETGLVRVTQADASGSYSILSLPVGPYEVTAERMGFRREVRRGIDLVVGQEAVVNLTLQVGSIDQQVTVTDAAPLVNTTLRKCA